MKKTGFYFASALIRMAAIAWIPVNLVLGMLLFIPCGILEMLVMPLVYYLFTGKNYFKLMMGSFGLCLTVWEILFDSVSWGEKTIFKMKEKLKC